MGVTSLIRFTSSPHVCSERIAVSRREPGPFTNTSTRFKPCSSDFRAAFSAAIWAAKGVPFLVPLNPTVPALAQEITSPLGSVIETIVLLNVDWICTTPCRTLRFSFGLFLASLPCFLAIDYLPFFRRTPTVRLGPLRVRALVLVRWPRTGRLRRWRSPR